LLGIYNQTLTAAECCSHWLFWLFLYDIISFST